jgi:A/G-specific adenine glycosylase
MQDHEELLKAQFTENLRLKGVSLRTINTFRRLIYGHSERNPRNLPWRKTRNPYRILVSEIMLQQTQVERVRDKYTTFIRTFPDFSSLAAAPLVDILRIWQGLGYNRRAKALQMLAGIVMEKYKGRLPNSYSELLELPGIGKYTAAAILTFTRNQPHVFIETNIRRVFIHLFFQDRDRISDAEILPLIEKTLDRENPRKWFYALMDYGVMLKKTGENPNKRSAHYQKQSPFHGSNRQIRGLLLKSIIRDPGISKKKLMKDLGLDPDKIELTLSLLTREGFLKTKGERFSIG